jgi:hypothetical protein
MASGFLLVVLRGILQVYLRLNLKSKFYNLLLLSNPDSRLSTPGFEYKVITKSKTSAVKTEVLHLVVLRGIEPRLLE